MDGWDSGFGMFRRLAESRSEGWTRDGVGWVTGWVEMGFSGGTKPSCFFVFNEMVGSFRNFTLLPSHSRYLALSAAVAKLVETAERAAELVVEAGFVAGQKVKRAGIVGEIAERDGCLSGCIVRRADLRAEGHAVHFVGEAGFLQTPDAHLTPAGDDHGLHEGKFDFGFGLEFFVECLEEAGEALDGFAFEHDRIGENAVADGVLGGNRFAFGRFRAGGFGGIGPIRGEAFFGNAHIEIYYA